MVGMALKLNSTHRLGKIILKKISFLAYFNLYKIRERTWGITLLPPLHHI